MRPRLRFSPAMIYPLLDRFIPSALRTEREMHQRARMFLISHLFGPFLGHVITVYLYVLDPAPGYALWVLIASISAFWGFPLALKYTGRYTVLALLSVQNLIFATLWGSYHYGGISSPFLPWLLTVPLFAFFYLGPAVGPRLLVLALIAANLSVFYLFYALGGSFPVHVPLHELVGIGIMSTISASVYVSMMALYYANIVANQSELEREVNSHRATAIKLHEAKNEAEAADRAKSEFLAKMSHELRTPLNAVIGYSDMLLEDAADEKGDEQQARDLKNINNAGKHLLSLVTDVLDLSKIEAGKMELVNERLDLNRLVDDVVESCRPQLEENHNELSIVRDGDLGPVEGDAKKLGQALQKILSNASKFTKNGRVTLTVGRSRIDGTDWINIAVRDTGIGISADELPTLFQNFSLMDSRTTSRYGGAGLGLSLTQKLCRLMGGEVTVESELDRGSCFTLRVPASLATTVLHQHDIGWTSDPGPNEAHPRRNTVLVVDDDATGLDLMQRFLTKEGYQPVLVDNPRSALAVARSVKPALIILDVLMPGMSGWELLRAFKADEELELIPVVILTIVDDRQMALSMGAVEHLVKPVDRDVLIRLLERLCPRNASKPKSATKDTVVANA
ncbi:MAG TPA: ATP-binding protein [Stellaceae bacterium]|nr:ATP-binding protein [Stellaceae bacterium]